MAKLKIILHLFLLICLQKIYTNATKLNYPRVLLPIFDRISVNFTLEVIEKGCFKWTSSRQDLILITPLYEDAEFECSHRATVTVVSRERRRNTAIVLAEDLHTGESLRCDVIIDVIDKLGVHTTTRQLYLEEAPETFELRAEDSQGNAFTTLEGIEFDWSITGPNEVPSAGLPPALRFLTFTESAYHEVPSDLEAFEVRGLKGYKVLLEGINTGAAKVNVRFPYKEYAHVSVIEVFISVLANILIEPAEVFIVPGDTINLRILQLKMGKLYEISLNDQYFLESESPTIANVQQNQVTGVKVGVTTILLRDRNVPRDQQLHTDPTIAKASTPSAKVTVAEPMKMGLSLLPYNNWITVEGEKHVIALDLYTRNDHKITLGSRYSFKSELNEMLFYILQRNKNGSRLAGQAVSEGTSPIYGSFKELSAQAELQIYPALSLHPQKVILPYDPNIIKTQKIQFSVKGGDGIYVWHTQNARVLQINQNGLASTIVRNTERRAANAGSAEVHDGGSVLTAHAYISVALSKNQKITRKAEVFFLPPVKLEVVQYNFETALEDYVLLHVALYAFVNGTHVPYNNCENLIFDLEFSNQIFQVDNNEMNDITMAPSACQIVHLRSTSIGISNLRISYNFQGKQLKDELTLSVFEKLRVMNPLANELVLPIGASRNVIYSHGPQRLFNLAAELSQSLEYDADIVSAAEITVDAQRSIYVHRILCRQVGETDFKFKIYNSLMSNNCQPYISHITTKVYCVKPRFLNLYATEQLRSSCPMELKNSLLHLKDREDKFEVEIEVQDAQNRKLMNISSLAIDWEFGADVGRYHNAAILHERQSTVEYVEGVQLPSQDLLVTTLPEVPANFRIKGVVSNYAYDVLHEQEIYPEEPPFGVKNQKTGAIVTPLIENEIRFMAVNTTIFSSDSISIFMSRNHRERLPIAQGSGFYDIQLSEPGIITVDVNAREKELVITPLRIGQTRIELTDRCLMSEPSFLTVAVVAIGSISAVSADRVERGKSIEAIVKLYDSNDNLLKIDSNNLHIYDLSEEIFNADVVSVKAGDQSDLQMGEIRYIIVGKQIGETKVIFRSGTNDNLITSEAVNIQVFPPLRLYPRNSTLIVGSSLQIYHHGGPQPDVNIVYEVHDKKIISMDSAISMALKLGDTKLTGKCVMTNPINGKQVIVSQDTVELHVVALQSIEIKTPLIRIRSGAVMPAAIWGVPDLSPMILGTLANMRVSWSTNDANVLSIYNVFADAGIEYTNNDLISVRIKALNPGKAKVHVDVELQDGRKLSSNVEVAVFKMLELEAPKHIQMDWILMAPRSSIQLKANLDDVLYKMDSQSKGIVKVSSDGIVQTQETLGRDLIISKSLEQTLPIGIEVKNVHYILASLIYPTVKLKQTELKIPRGMNFVMKVSLHDNLGNEFSHNIEDVNGVKYELSHRDIVDVQIGNNLTLMLNLPRETTNMLAVTLKDTNGVKHAEDYIKLAVAESKHIFPTKTIFSVGDIICFDSPLTLTSIWSSSDEQIVSIDRYSGVARVIGNRFKLGEKILISNGLEQSSSFIKYAVEVRDADVLHLMKSFDIFSGTNYRAHLIIRNRLQLDKETNLVAHNVTKCAQLVENARFAVKQFNCQLSSRQTLGQDLLAHYKVYPIFDVALGRYACQIELTSTFDKVLNLVKNNDVTMELQVTLSNGLSDSGTLKFVPGIKVTPTTLFADLSNNVKEQDLTITGLDKVLQQVTVLPSDAKLLAVSLKSKTVGALHFVLKVLKTLSTEEELFVNVSSPSTMQEIKLPVIGTSIGQTCQKPTAMFSPESLLQLITFLGTVVIGILVLALIIWLYVVCSSDRKSLDFNETAFKQSPNSSRNPFNTSSERTPPRNPFSPVYPSSLHSDSLGNLSAGNESTVYGDTVLHSPQKRINRRYL